jgi:hypothetical protein
MEGIVGAVDCSFLVLPPFERLLTLLIDQQLYSINNQKHSK